MPEIVTARDLRPGDRVIAFHEPGERVYRVDWTVTHTDHQYVYGDGGFYKALFLLTDNYLITINRDTLTQTERESMTRQHFNAIANIIKAERERSGLDKSALQACDAIAHSLASQFRHVNPSFNEERFLTACGLELNQ